MSTLTTKKGFTLIECALVVAIISIIATFAVVKISGTLEKAKATAATHDLKVLSAAFTDSETGYLKDLTGIAGFSVGNLRIANLFMATNAYGAFGHRVDDEMNPIKGFAPREAFVYWNAESERGWHGPYISAASGEFPDSQTRRFADDQTASERGFFPPLTGLREPEDFLNGRGGSSIYGFPGEPALMDPWGNPYVLQIPPPQAFRGSNTNLPDEVRFRYARVVSAGPDGRLDTPCFGINLTNRWWTTWGENERRLARQAGRLENSTVARGDDLVYFLNRADIDEGRDE